MASNGKSRKAVPVVTTAENKKNHFSDFMLTINTNKHFDPELRKNLKEGTDAIFSGANVYNYIRFVQDGDVENIKVHIGQPEMGTRGFLHVHVTIQMEHNAKVQIDVKKLQEAYAEKLGFQPYVRFKLENNWRRYQMDYTDKSLNVNVVVNVTAY